MQLYAPWLPSPSLIFGASVTDPPVTWMLVVGAVGGKLTKVLKSASEVSVQGDGEPGRTSSREPAPAPFHATFVRVPLKGFVGDAGESSSVWSNCKACRRARPPVISMPGFSGACSLASLNVHGRGVQVMASAARPPSRRVPRVTTTPTTCRPRTQGTPGLPMGEWKRGAGPWVRGFAARAE